MFGQNSVLLFSNDYSVINIVSHIITTHKINLHIAKSSNEVFELLEKEYFDLLVVDLSNNDFHNDFLENLSKESYSIPTVCIKSNNGTHINNLYQAKTCVDFFEKPLEPTSFSLFIEDFFKKLTLISEIYEKRLDTLRKSISIIIPHEFRTAINSIQGYSELIIKTTNDKNKLVDEDINNINEMARYINSEIRKIFRLIENIILYSQLTTFFHNKTKIKELRSNFIQNPKEIITEIIENFPEEIKNSYNFIVNVNNANIQISYYYFYKLIYELIDNSIKFSPLKSSIEIHGKELKKDYYLKIKDNGRGMSKNQINNIGAFQQFDRQIYEQQGTGLGLIIAKLISQLFGGNFKIDSLINKGTSIEISLPIKF